VRCVEGQKQLLPMHGRATGQWRYKRYFNGVARNMKPVLIALACFLMLCASVAQAGSNTLSVTEYHNGPDRSGHYVVPGLTWDRARNIHATAGFRGDIQGHVYAQPLYWHPSGSSRGLIITATEDDAVYALDSKTGALVWKRSLGDPVSSFSLSCGNIEPLGITEYSGYRCGLAGGVPRRVRSSIRRPAAPNLRAFPTRWIDPARLARECIHGNQKNRPTLQLPRPGSAWCTHHRWWSHVRPIWRSLR